MTDIRTVMLPVPPGQPPLFDWAIEGPSLEADDGLETAVIISLFTDRRANADDVLPDGGDDRRGWWGDGWPDVDRDKIGSRLWLLSREKDMRQVVNRAREYARESLQWLIDDGVARQVEVSAGWVDRISGALTDSKTATSADSLLGLNATIYRKSGAAAKYQFALFWRGA
jgi:phage gp46-like protein